MPTITENLTKLDQLRKDLATNVSNKGVTADQTEKLSTLVPKVAEITNYDSGLKLQSKTVNPIPWDYDKKPSGKDWKQAPQYQNITPDSGYDGLSKVVVNPITKDISENIIPENIAWGYTILGVTGTFMSKLSAVITTRWGRPGSTVKLSLYIVSGNACNDYDFRINFDSPLKYISAEGSDTCIVDINTPNSVKFNRLSNSYILDRTPCLKLNFEIPSDATSGIVYNIKFDKNSAHFYNNETGFDVRCLAPGKITVI